MILLIRSDSHDVYAGLWQDGEEKVAKSWQAGRELSGQILSVIEDICAKVTVTVSDVEGIIVYEGPGSYTGLRISMSVVNALGSTYGMPVVGASGDDWQRQGFEKLATQKSFQPVTPVYGGDVYTTKPRK